MGAGEVIGVQKEGQGSLTPISISNVPKVVVFGVNFNYFSKRYVMRVHLYLSQRVHLYPVRKYIKIRVEMMFFNIFCKICNLYIRLNQFMQKKQ